jgi:hypothetical protein
MFGDEAPGYRAPLCQKFALFELNLLDVETANRGPSHDRPVRRSADSHDIIVIQIMKAELCSLGLSMIFD